MFGTLLLISALALCWCVFVCASCLFVFCRRGMAQRGVSQVALGLLECEAVLRGGHLTAPVVLQNVHLVGGKQFVRLAQSDKALCQFLCGQCRQFRPFSTCAVFKKMVALRRAFVLEFLDPSCALPRGGDQAAELGLDAQEAPRIKKLRRSKKVEAIKRQLPEWFDATLSAPGRPDWHVAVLVESGNVAPCIELTQANLDELLAIVQVERDEASGDSPKKVASSRSPRGERGSREYWIQSKHRWVGVRYESDVGDASRKKKRTLLRRPSDTPAILPLGAPGPVLPLVAPTVRYADSGLAPEGEEALRQEHNDPGASDLSRGDGGAYGQVPQEEDTCASIFD